jgi:hypothetical protein
MRQRRETKWIEKQNGFGTFDLIADDRLLRTCSFGCPNRIFRGAPSFQRPASVTGGPPFRNGKQLGTLREAPVIVAPLTWRIGMTAPVFERGLGPLLIQTPASRCRLRFLIDRRRRFIGRARPLNLGQVVLTRRPVNLPESRKFPTAPARGAIDQLR